MPVMMPQKPRAPPENALRSNNVLADGGEGSVDLGFDTAGNATLIVYDHGPLLVTDPWTDGPAYFGSWTHAYEIGEEQRQAIRDARFVWISHGHPDHLSNRSVEALR